MCSLSLRAANRAHPSPTHPIPHRLHNSETHNDRMAPIPLAGARVLVTGGCGFIGSKLVKKLVAAGAHVRVVDNLWRGKLETIENVIDIGKDFVLADLTDAGKAMTYIRDADIIYHLADVVAGIDYVFNNETSLFRDNLLINSNVIAACVRNGIPNYIYVGTACAFPRSMQQSYGEVSLPESTTYPAEPESAYGWSKLMGEYEAELAQKYRQLNVGILRLHNIYGEGAPYDPRTSQALPAMCRKVINGEPMCVFGSGEQYRDFLHVDDVTDALMLMPERGMNQGVIQIGTGRAIRIKYATELIVALGKENGFKTDPFFDTTKPEGDKGRVAVLDRCKSILGFTAKVAFEEGIRRQFNDILTRIQFDRPAIVQHPKETDAAFIPQMCPWTDDEEADAIYRYMKSGGWLTEFKANAKFEKELAAFTGHKHAITLSNGTVTLSIALITVGVTVGDEVILPNWTMAATPAAIKLIGAVPIFVDVDAETGCIDVDQAMAAVTPRTKAMFHVSLNARSNNVGELARRCKQKGIFLIEDSAQALGSYHNGLHLGNYGCIASFSFSPPKIITTAQGGSLHTNDDAHAARIHKLKDFGRIGGGIDFHELVGWNHKFTDIQATLGLVQMKKLPWRVNRMGQIWNKYRTCLKPSIDAGHFQFGMPVHDHKKARELKSGGKEQGWIPWFVDIFVKKAPSSMRSKTNVEVRAALKAYLKSQGLGSREVYPPLHTQGCYPEWHGEGGKFPVCMQYCPVGLWLPSSTAITDPQIERVCNDVNAFFAGRARL